jgi:hypothetical protein
MQHQPQYQDDADGQDFRERAISEWATTLRTTPDKLKEALGAVGASPKKVEAHLRQGS